MTEAAVATWLKAYGAAWERHDGAAAAELFAAEGTYCWGPFAPPLIGHEAIRARWQEATAQHGQVRFRAETVATDGDRVVAHWHVTLRPADGAALVELDGIFVLDFDADGRCTRLQEWWMNRPPEP